MIQEQEALESNGDESEEYSSGQIGIVELGMYIQGFHSLLVIVGAVYLFSRGNWIIACVALGIGIPQTISSVAVHEYVWRQMKKNAAKTPVLNQE